MANVEGRWWQCRLWRWGGGQRMGGPLPSLALRQSTSRPSLPVQQAASDLRFEHAWGEVADCKVHSGRLVAGREANWRSQVRIEAGSARRATLQTC